MMKEKKPATGRLLTATQIEELKKVIVNYRRLAGQCSNATFNFGQTCRSERHSHEHESSSELVRDFDRAEGRLVYVLEKTGLFMSFAEAAEAEKSDS